MPLLTVAQISSRDEPRFDWMIESLKVQLRQEDEVEIILVDKQKKNRKDLTGGNIRHVVPKPTIWQGKHRLTNEDWWDASCYRNTALCYAKDGWILWLDDRLALSSNFMDGVRDAMKMGYASFGSYQKVHNLVVENGLVTSYLENEAGRDNRASQMPKDAPYKSPGNWSFGCCVLCPVEWALKIGGWEEFMAGGLGYEDPFFGIMLENNKYPCCFDRRMKVWEDRTPDKVGPVMRREDKGPSGTNFDKSHQMLAALTNATHTMNQFNIVETRKRIQNGGQFEVPTWPKFDWFDGEPIAPGYGVRRS